MTKYSIQVNSKGTILSLKVENPDPIRFPSGNLIGKNFSRLIGNDHSEWWISSKKRLL